MRKVIHISSLFLAYLSIIYYAVMAVLSFMSGVTDSPNLWPNVAGSFAGFFAGRFFLFLHERTEPIK
jgi:hypothetical protein